MNDISQNIQTIIIIAVIAGMLIYSFMLYFPQKRKKEIYILKKRETAYKGLNQTRSKTIICNNYTVDCKYSSNGKIHTLGCSYDIYNKIREGKSYIVYVELNHIISLKEK